MSTQRPEYQLRVMKEAGELRAMNEKLVLFLDTAQFQNLPRMEQHRLRTQAGLQSQLLAILAERIAHFSVE